MAQDTAALSIAIAALNQGKSGIVNSVNGKKGAVTLYGTDINMSADTSLPTVTEQITSNKDNISSLATAKQDKLTAGNNIVIASNVISVTGLTPVSGTNDGTDWKTITIGNVTRNIPSVIPPAPTTNGNYHLKCSVVDGVTTYTWVDDIKWLLDNINLTIINSEA